MTRDKPIAEEPKGYIDGKISISVQKTDIDKKSGFFNLPTSSSTDMMMKVLGAGGDGLKRLQDTSKRISHAQEITIRENGSRRQIIAKSPNSETIIEIGDIEKLLGSNKAAKKLFSFLLIKMNEQAFNHSSGTLYRDEVSFSLQELVDLGFYSDTRNARRGVNTAMDTLTSLKLKAKIQNGRKSLSTTTEEDIEGILVLFTGYVISKGQCRISINYRVNWQPLFQYFTVLPRFAFSLTNRGFDLLYAVVFFARQKIKQIGKHGAFNLSFRTIQQRLDLPSEKENKDPQRTIKQPIEEAVADIMRHIKSATSEAQDLSITSVYDPTSNIKDFLDNGYLKVKFSGEYAAPFIEQHSRKEQKIEKIQRRKEAIDAKQKSTETPL